MYHALFEAQERWAIQYPDPVLVALAQELGLETGSFEACLGSREALERVLEDLYDAQGVAQSTPTFVAIYGGRGAVLTGARSSDEFVPILENLLESANAQE
jgi:predicted DsbA family dithiol-disulfide isomerase